MLHREEMGQEVIKMKKLASLCVLLTFFLSSGAIAQTKLQPSTGGGVGSKYEYYYKGKLISLRPSRRLIAIDETGTAFRDFVKLHGLKRDPLSERGPLKKRNLGLYGLPTPADKRIDLQTEIEKFAQTTAKQIQPVFEQGQALLIPSDEVIVGLKKPLGLAQAKSYFAPHAKSQGIVDVREHRKNTYILRIDNPSNGRVYQVSQFLAQQEGIDFAEPNHIVLFLGEPRPPRPPAEIHKELMGREKKRESKGEAETSSLGLYQTSSSVVWTILIDESFEEGSLPTGWSTDIYDNPDDDTDIADAYWSVTGHRSHSGTGSCYATGGGAEGVSPPGDYPNNCNSRLATPVLNLASYEEVYIEFWFYAKFGSHNLLAHDLGAVMVRTPTPEDSTILSLLYVGYTGDLTADPTTDNGWRRALLRVPPKSRVNGVNVEFVLLSDESGTGEGLYIDQVRILGTTDVDTDPIGNDTYGARQYETRNAGQIAGLGNDDNDMHLPEAWDLVSVSPDIVVAVIDSGVDVTIPHPDLNLVTGYEPDGSIGGSYKSSDGTARYHGTAVAGNVGAVGDNSLGVFGTAPGVRIMPVYFGGSESELASAIDVAVANGAHILSNSWHWIEASSTDIENAIIDALNAGRVVLFAAGNGPDREPYTYDVAFPGNLTGSTDVICVGASSPTDEHKAAASSDGHFMWGSSYVGSGPDVTAPSPWSYTTDIQGDEGYNPETSLLSQGSLIDPGDPSSEDYTPTFGGTSSSTPKIAGIAALMLSANPDLTPHQVKEILRETADDIDVPGIDDKTGAGRVNAYGSVLGALMRKGLKVHYSFDASAQDKSGNGNHGIIHGGTFTTDRFGNADKALQFDGIDDFVEIPNESDFDLQTFTISTIIKVGSLEKENWVISKGPYFGNFTITIYDNEHDYWPGYAGCVYQTAEGNWSWLIPENAVPVGEFFHLAVTIDSSSFKSYINGDLARTALNPAPPRMNNERVTVGAGGYYAVSSFFTGIIDDLRIYNRVLSEIEIRALSHDRR
jgi:subtilisin family serine protease